MAPSPPPHMTFYSLESANRPEPDPLPTASSHIPNGAQSPSSRPEASTFPRQGANVIIPLTEFKQEKLFLLTKSTPSKQEYHTWQQRGTPAHGGPFRSPHTTTSWGCRVCSWSPASTTDLQRPWAGGLRQLPPQDAVPYPRAASQPSFAHSLCFQPRDANVPPMARVQGAGGEVSYWLKHRRQTGCDWLLLGLLGRFPSGPRIESRESRLKSQVLYYTSSHLNSGNCL